jgi:Flp pilus assembly pilin Flp
MMWRRVVRTLRQLARRDSGQDLIEYGLLVFLIAVVVLAGVRTLGTTINTVFWEYIAAN